LAFGAVFSTPDFIGVAQALCEPEAVSGDAQAGVGMQSPPTPALVVPQAEVLLEVLVVALEAPTHLGASNTMRCSGISSGPVDSPILERLRVALGPLDEPPLGGAPFTFIAPTIPVRCPHLQPGKA